MEPAIEYQEQLFELFKELDKFMYDFESYDPDAVDEEDEQEFDEDAEDEGNSDEEDDNNGNTDQEVYVQPIDDEDGEDDNDDDESEEEDVDYEPRWGSKKQSARPPKPEKTIFLDILNRIMKVVRQASSAEYPGLPGLIERVDQAVSKAIKFAYDDDHYGPYVESHVPSFAHDKQEGGAVALLLHDCSELDSGDSLNPVFHSIVHPIT